MYEAVREIRKVGEVGEVGEVGVKKSPYLAFKYPS